MLQRKKTIRFILLFGVILFCFSCERTSSRLDWSAYKGPTRFEQTLLLEKFTATWCGGCPKGVTFANELSSLYPNVIVLAYHISDELSTGKGDEIAQLIKDDGGVPSGTMQRTPRLNFVPQGQLAHFGTGWKDIANQNYKAEGVGVGLSIESELIGSELAADVSIHHSREYESPVFLTVIISENGIIAPQKNYYNEEADSEFYQKGTLIDDFEHNHVVREVLSSPSGDLLEVDQFIEKISYRIPIDTDWNTSELEITAFIHYMEDDDKRILNARRVTAGSAIDAGGFVQD